jgi:hypothetical protein
MAKQTVPPDQRRRRFLKGTTLALPAVMTLGSTAAQAAARTSLACGQPPSERPCRPLAFAKDEFFRERVACYDQLIAQKDRRGQIAGYSASGVAQYFEGIGSRDQQACWRYVATGEPVSDAEIPFINAPGNSRSLDLKRSLSAKPCREGLAIVHFSARDGSVLAVGEPRTPPDALVTSLSGACLKSLWGRAG